MVGVMEDPRLASEGQTGSNREVFEERVRNAQIEARARNISHNVRCLECGHQSIEESQADIAVKLRKVIRDELREGRSDKEIYNKLTTDYGETILYSPAFDAQSAVLWLLPVMTVGAIAGVSLYRGRGRAKSVEAMADALLRGIPLSPSERRAIEEIIIPPPKPVVYRFSPRDWFSSARRKV